MIELPIVIEKVVRWRGKMWFKKTKYFFYLWHEAEISAIRTELRPSHPEFHKEHLFPVFD